MTSHVASGDSAQVQGYAESYRGEGHAQHALSTLRQNRVAEYVDAHDLQRVVEIGLGDNPLVFHLQSQDVQVLSIELNADFIEEQLPRVDALFPKQLGIIKGSFLDPAILRKANATLPNPDLVVANSLLHEIPDLQTGLAAIHSLGGQGCRVWINVPNPSSFHYEVWDKLREHNGLSASNTASRFGRRRDLSVEAWRQTLETAGFLVNEIRSYGVKPVTLAQLDAFSDSVESGRSLVESMLGLEVPGFRGAELDIILTKP